MNTITMIFCPECGSDDIGGNGDNMNTCFACNASFHDTGAKQKTVEKLPDEISISWHIDDVKSLDESLSDDDCRVILQRAEHDHDATIGINWEVLQYYIDEYKKGEK